MMNLVTGVGTAMLLVGSILFNTDLAAQTASTDRARATVDTLTSAAMSGRGYERDGHLVAARYIASSFRSNGLDSLATGYLHPFRFMFWGFDRRLSLRLGDREMIPGSEFIPAGRSGSGSLVGEKRIVRAGDGLVAPFAGIDAYAKISPMGAVVVIDDKVSPSAVADTTIPRARLASWSRIEDAIRLGARGVILLVDRLTYEGPQRGIGIPVFEVLRDSFPAETTTISFTVGRAPREVTSNNVVAMVPGDGSTDSLVMIVGHYDHLGMLGDSVYFPGANDNAGGIALMLDLAAELKTRRLRYPVLFVAFSAEEVGLVGSGNFAERPPLDISRVRFLINLDMVASGTDGVMALGGVESPDELALLRAVADSLGGVEIRSRSNAPNSDHYFFLEKGIEGFYLYPFVGYQPYHNVADRAETLQWEVYGRMRGLVVGLLRGL